MGIRVAILDMNNQVANKGLGYLRTIVQRYSDISVVDVFDVRAANEVPDSSYDLYLSSGGPGSPYDLDGWSSAYFGLIDQLMAHNLTHTRKKYMFFICHSFQLACMHFRLGQLTERHIMSFGVHPVFKAKDSAQDAIFSQLPDPFYVADFRFWQVIQPDKVRFEALGAEILAIEQPHGERERAIMAIRFTDEMLGTQFHPEADAPGMLQYLHEDERRFKVIEEYGEDGYRAMLDHVSDPDHIALTSRTVLPMFIAHTIASLKLQVVETLS